MKCPSNALLASRRRQILGIFFAACSSFSGPLAAQNLMTLFEAAKNYDAQYLSAKALAQSAPYLAAQSKSLARPNATLTANASRVQTEITDRTNESTNTAVGLQARQTLFNRANNATIEQADKSVSVATFDLQTAEQELIISVARAYFDVLGAQDELFTTRASKAAIAEQLASAKRNFEVGTTTITDAREAQARFDLVSALEIAGQNDLQTKQAALDQLVGQANVEPKPLAKNAILPPLQPSLIDDWVNYALSNHPLILRTQKAYEIAQLEASKAQAEHWPTLDAIGSISNNRAPTSISSTSNTSTQTASLGLQLNVPIYSGHATQNRVKETLLLAQRAHHDLMAANRGVTLSTRQAFYAVESGLAQVSALEAAQSSSQLALDATKLGYKVGVRVNLDVLNAQTQLFTTQRDLSRSRYNVLLGGLLLRQATGQLQSQDLMALNRLLLP